MATSHYPQCNGIKPGSIFTTTRGDRIDQSNVLRKPKKLVSSEDLRVMLTLVTHSTVLVF